MDAAAVNLNGYQDEYDGSTNQKKYGLCPEFVPKLSHMKQNMDRISTIFGVRYMDKMQEVQKTDQKHFNKINLS